MIVVTVVVSIGGEGGNIFLEAGRKVPGIMTRAEHGMTEYARNFGIHGGSLMCSHTLLLA